MGRAEGFLAEAPHLPGRLLHGLAGSSLERAVRGRVVMVTGASSGIGRATALRVASAGGLVLLVARRRDALVEVRRSIESAGGEAHVHPCDLADPEDSARLIAGVIAGHDHVDVLVNNAGRSIRRPVRESYERVHDYERTMQINYFGAVRLVLGLLPGMRERRSGHVVNISSQGVQLSVPNYSAYVASKAALDAFSRCIAPEVQGDGVRITTVYMPLVRTPMSEAGNVRRPMPALSPEQAAELVADAIAHRPRRVATPVGNLVEIAYAAVPGAVGRVVDGAYRLLSE